MLNYRVIYKIGDKGNVHCAELSYKDFEKLLTRYTMESSKVIILSFENISGQMTLEV